MGPAARAVILERASGQVVMGAVAALSFASLPLTRGAVPATLTLAVCGVGVAALAAHLAFGRRPPASPLATLGHDVHTALLARDALLTLPPRSPRPSNTRSLGPARGR